MAGSAYLAKPARCCPTHSQIRSTPLIQAFFYCRSPDLAPYYSLRPTFNVMTMNQIINLNKRNGWLGFIPDQGLKALLDPENAVIRRFLIEQSQLLPPKSAVLDGGAGKKPYQGLFKEHSYHSCDMPGGFYSTSHDFECFLDTIPVADNTYDAVVLTQVLEHTPNPGAVLAEINRILKPGGRLLLSVPLNGPLHGEPWHFFHFTHYGICQLSGQTGFTVTDCEKMGGNFWCLGKRLPDAFKKLLKQFDPFRAKKRGMGVAYCVAMTLAILPIYLIGYGASAYLIRPLFYYLDFLDYHKAFTLGYTAVLQKKFF
jgi:SAM-dependent methyltransferase